jgi:pyrroloquinoline quinone biosynthesis protein B
VDIAFLDGTFFDAAEIPGRDSGSIAHPCIEDSIRRFSGLPDAERKKIRFIHLNHTNPAIQPRSSAAARVEQAGHAIACQGDLIAL